MHCSNVPWAPFIPCSVQVYMYLACSQLSLFYSEEALNVLERNFVLFLVYEHNVLKLKQVIQILTKILWTAYSNLAEFHKLWKPLWTLTVYVVPEKIHAHPMEGHRKFLGGGGIWKAKILKEKYEVKLEFLGGGRVQNKQLSVGEV